MEFNKLSSDMAILEFNGDIQLNLEQADAYNQFQVSLSELGSLLDELKNE